MGDRPLRDGFTTGTCAAAAAKAAAVLLCRQSDNIVSDIEKHLLIQVETPAGITACLEAECVGVQTGKVSCRVQKDAGDDPDVTDRTWIHAELECLDHAELQQLIRQNHGYMIETQPLYYLIGGEGVGMATKPGLSCPPGKYAINPVPRGMIIAAVAEVCREAGCDQPMVIRIAVPAGEMLAARTFNPKLGILGGISIIGTTGIVKPMSEDALRDTIKLELHMKVLEGKEPILVVPGNYGESFLKEQLGVSIGTAVICSNFIAETVEFAVAEGVKKLLLTGHIGKLIKITGGVRNTHSRYGDRRMELLSRLTEPYDKNLALRIRDANTTEEAVGMLEEYHLGETVLTDLAGAVQKQLELWGQGRLQAEVVTFSTAYGILGMTCQVPLWVTEVVAGCGEDGQGG